MNRQFLKTFFSLAAGLVLTIPAVCAIPQYRFGNIIHTNYYGGLHSIAKDNTGYIWACGHDAVLRYDGYEFVFFNNDIESIHPEDYWNYDNVVAAPNGGVFVGSNHGLVYCDGRGDLSIVIEGNVGSLCASGDDLWMVLDGTIVSVGPDMQPVRYEMNSSSEIKRHLLSVMTSRGNVYAAWENNLMILDRDSLSFVDILALPSGTSVKDVLEAGIDKLYVLTPNSGMYCFDGNGEMEHILPGRDMTAAKTLYSDPNGIIWASSQKGLMFYNPESGEYSFNSFKVNNPYSLPISSVWDISEDGEHGVWLSTYGGGLLYTDLSASDLAYFGDELPYPIVSCFGEGPDGQICVGTEGGGIAVFDTHAQRISNINTANGLASNYVKYICSTASHGFLVSTFRGAVHSLDFTSGKVSKVSGTQGISAYSVVEGSDGGCWMSSPDEGIWYLDRNHVIERLNLSYGASGQIRNVAEIFLNGEYLYIITNKGLYVVDEKSKRVLDCKYLPGASFASNHLNCHLVHSSGQIWVGTNGAGINVLAKDGSYAPLQVNGENPLADSIVCGMLQDNASGDVWISAADGFYVYDSESGTISHEYRVALNGAAMHRACYVRRADGKMYFGSTNGFVTFTPSRLPKDVEGRSAFASHIRLNGDEVAEDALMNLMVNNSHVEIDLACDSYRDRGFITYAYCLDGLSNSWTPLPRGQRTIILQNLRPGKYSLKVKVAGPSGNWSAEKTLFTMRVKPSPLLSWWAILIYVFVLSAAVIVFIRVRTNRKLLEQQLVLEQEKAEYLRESAVARNRFFTNISHDLKTPLSLVEDPLKRMREHLPEDSDLENYVSAIERNVNRISHMIAQLLHFREIESQKIVLNNQEGDFIRFARDIFYLFEPYATQKGIEMVFKSQSDSLIASFDHDVIEKILSNLCSNAIKYTVNEGFVGMNITCGEHDIHLSVVNTGTGIPDDMKELIFNEFAKLPGQHPNFQSTTGLGLAIVKELVNTLNGHIEMNSSDSRVEFAVTIPYQKASNASYDLNNEYDYTSAEVDNLFCNYIPKSTPAHTSRKANSILVVDDDPQLRSYLETNLSDKFNVYSAADGADGIAKADKINPEVIVSDLVMPNMDGCELCRHIRDDIRVSHIPVIVLSGLDDKQAKLKAMEAGANVYMEKPVDIQLLISQIEGLIRSHEEMKQKYSKRFIAEPEKLVISSMDEKLLEKAMSCIEKNMSNFDYDVDAFVSDMAMGRTVLYRKINDITGMSIKEFIMDIRLKRAVQLIKESDYNVSEISMMTGFINPKYFSVCFKRHFDMTPTEYKKKLG